ncbi:Putative F-box and FNIP repeat-containing protein L60 [Durusdinium trenchii]|uniref:F-box and FNIP repeat-containing protein L60 n=1 Tax=Durusdinium trenchii TaxID=1381693 RepID=A0ABP0SQ54_9DINO
MVNRGDLRDMPDGAEMQLKVVGLDGEELVLQVPETLTGREVRQRIAERLVPKVGARVSVQRGSELLAPLKTLKEQGVHEVSFVYIPVSLQEALRVLQFPRPVLGASMGPGSAEFGAGDVDEVLALEGIVRLSGLQSLELRELPRSLVSLTFGSSFNQSLVGVSLPQSLQSLKFGSEFNQSLDGVNFPHSIQNLTFGRRFNQKVDKVAWPSNLQSLVFGDEFNQSLDSANLPDSLEILILGDCFDERLDGITWPSSLQSLTFGFDFNQPVYGVSWPKTLQSLTFGESFDQDLQGVTWPESLQHLNFGVCFNVSVDGVPWPRHLRSLKFGGHFNQSLEGVTLPDTLESLTFGHRFDQSLDGVNLPHSLQSLTFDNYFNQSLNGVTLPSNLQHLTFGNEFNQSLEQVTFPEHLQSLTFGDDFDQSLEQVVWPSNLKSLTLGQHFNQSLLKDGTLPTTLLRLDLKGLILSAEGYGRTTCHTVMCRTGTMESDEVEEKPEKVSSARGVLWVANVYPTKAFRFDMRHMLTRHNHETLIPQLLPDGVEVTRMVPREKEGGAFVYFRAPPTFVLQALRNLAESNPEAVTKMRFVPTDDILLKVSEGICQYFRTHDVRAFLCPHPVRAHRVKGTPYLEDFASRYPSSQLQIRFDPTGQVKEEQLYEILRRYGQLEDLQATEQGYLASFRYTAGAVAARNCLHRALVEAKNADGPRFQIDYKQFMQKWIWETITSNARLIFPIFVVLMFGTTYFIWDPMRSAFVHLKIASIFSSPPPSSKASNTAAPSSVANGSAEVSTGYQGLQGFLLRFVSEARASLRPKTSARDLFNDFWAERQAEIAELKDWVDQPPERVLLLTGHRGNGLHEMMKKLIGGRTLEINVRDMLEAGGAADDHLFLRAFSRAVGYWPAQGMDRQLSAVLDLMLPGSGKQLSRENELLVAVQRVLFASTQALQAWKARSSASLKFDATPLILITGFTSENKDRRPGFFEALVSWAAYVQDIRASSVRRILQHHLDDTALSDQQLKAIGGRYMDISAMLGHMRHGVAPNEAVRWLLETAEVTVRRLLLTGQPNARWTRPQLWRAIRLLESSGSLRCVAQHAHPEPGEASAASAAMDGRAAGYPSDASIDGRVEIEACGLDGEVVVLRVPESLTGAELRQRLAEILPRKPGTRAVVQKGSAMLEPLKTLKDQGLGAEATNGTGMTRRQVSYLYEAANLQDAWRCLNSLPVDEGCALEGVTHLEGLSHLHQLADMPSNLRSLTFAWKFNASLAGVTLPRELLNLTFGRFDQSLHQLTWPPGLQCLSFGHHFNQSLEQITFPESLQSLSFGDHFNQSLQQVVWPKHLQSLKFGDHFNQSLEGVLWPSRLQKLTFGKAFDRSLEQVVWPENLDTLSFGERFQQSLEGVAWPSALQSLVFGKDFNQSLEDVTWPASLQSVVLRDRFNQSLERVTWPEGLRGLGLDEDFDQTLDPSSLPNLEGLALGITWKQSCEEFAWPPNLQSLLLGGDFNQPLERVTWPSKLLNLTLGKDFNQSIEGVTWPNSLRYLAFGFHFNQSLVRVKWPSSLQILNFGVHFNQTLEEVAWPPGLQNLTFGYHFNQSLQQVIWPKALQILTFGFGFDQTLEAVQWPISLESLTFGHNFNQPLTEVTFPSSLRSITFGKSFNQTLEHVAWPSHLQCLSFGRDFDQTLEPVTWPSCLQILTLGFRFNQSLQRVAWPPQLQSLTLGYLFNQSLENVTLPRSLQHLVVKDVVLSACQEQKQAAAQHGPTYSCSGKVPYDVVLWGVFRGDEAALRSMKESNLIAVNPRKSESESALRYDVEAGSPLYAEVFRRLVQNEGLGAVLDLEVAKEDVAREQKTVDLYEAELVRLEEILDARRDWWFSSRRLDAQLESRVEQLVDLIMEQHKKLEKYHKARRKAMNTLAKHADSFQEDVRRVKEKVLAG